MLTDDEPLDPMLMGPEVRPRFQSEYEAQPDASSAPEAAAAATKRSRGRPAKGGKWQVCDLQSLQSIAACTRLTVNLVILHVQLVAARPHRTCQVRQTTGV